MKALDGPRIGPKRGRAASLIVLLHGYGANGDDLIALGEAWRETLPTAAFIAPNAPDPLPHAALGGLQWFPLTFRDPGEYWRGVSAVGPLLDAFLDRELLRYGLPGERLALVGFSQGTMLALHIAPRRLPAMAAVVGYSGMLAGPEHLAHDIRSHPPTLLVHGAQDDLIPVDMLHFSREALAENGIPVEWHVAERLGHGIDADGLRLGGSFLREMLGQRTLQRG